MLQSFSKFCLTAVCISLGVTAAPSQAQTVLTTELVTDQLERPIFLTHAPDDNRLFILEKRGRIRIIKDGVLLPTPFLDIDSLVGGGTSDFDERGLLGLTFAPDYQSSGYFYVNYTNGAGNTTVARYTVSANPDIADPASAHTIIVIDQPQSNHNGGWIDFGPGGCLFIGMGDGGGAGDNGFGHTAGVGNGQDITDNLLGKMLRLDVTGDDFPDDDNRNYAIPADNPFVGITGDDEIWAFGLRNPWRNSFDRDTGDLWIADVGQSSWEEINVQPANSSGGENYGWRCREGMHDFDTSGDCSQTPFTEPIYEYGHNQGCAITGGYVYRGCAVPDLQGTYFFADYCSSRIWSFRYDGTTVTEFTDRTSELSPGGGLSIATLSSFGEDAAGELYILDQTDGEIFKIVRADGGSGDCCKGDLDGDRDVDQADLGILLAAYLQSDGGDLDGDGDTDQADLGILLSMYGTTCP